MNSRSIEESQAGRSERDASAMMAHPANDACPACGTEVRRAAARYCATCGRTLDGGGYLPSDALRASYHQQRQPAPVPAFTLTPPSGSSDVVQSPAPRRRAPRPKVSHAPFVQNNNGASTTALAFVTYALVPYLGILFCPGALLMGSVGLWRARRATHQGGRRAAYMSILLGLLLFVAQLFLWWLLYKVPEWSRSGGGY